MTTVKKVTKKAAAKKTAKKSVASASKKRAAKKRTTGQTKQAERKNPARTTAAKAAPASKSATTKPAKMLFRPGDLVVHESKETVKVTRGPYALKTIITIDGVEMRDGKAFGKAKPFAVDKFVAPAKPLNNAAKKQDATKGSGKATTKKTSQSKTARKDGAKPTKQAAPKPTVAAAMRQLFAEHGLDATYDQALSAARKAKPESKFGQSHWAWYRSKFKKQKAAGEKASK